MARTHEIRIRVTAKEHDELKRAAHRDADTLGAWLRRTGLRRARGELATPTPAPAAPEPDPHAAELAAIKARLAELRRERRTLDRASDSGASAPRPRAETAADFVAGDPDGASDSGASGPRRFVRNSDVGPSPAGLPRDAKGRGLVTKPSENADELGEAIRAARGRAERSAQQTAELVHVWFSQQTQVAPGNHAIEVYTWRKRISKLENGAATGDRKPTRGDNWKPSPAALREILAALAAVLNAPELRPEHWRGKVL